MVMMFKLIIIYIETLPRVLFAFIIDLYGSHMVTDDSMAS